MAHGQLRIDKMFAYIALDPADNTEGVIAAPVPGMGNALTMPLVGADMDRMTSLWPIAEQVAKATGTRVTLVEFSTRTEIDVIEP